MAEPTVEEGLANPLRPLASLLTVMLNVPMEDLVK